LFGKIVSNLSDDTKEKNNQENKQKTIINDNTKSIHQDKQESSSIAQKNQLATTMYLSSQKESTKIDKAQIISQAKTIIEEDKTEKGIKKSAEKLNLNVSEIKTDINEKQTSIDPKQALQPTINKTSLYSNTLNKMAILKEQHEFVDIDEIKKSSSESVSKPATSESQEKTIQINVPSNTIQSLQTKIIGAHQKVSSFMSDLARNMYLNYKPPVTAFRMNLNPSNLGNIAVVIRSNKIDNTLNISMNMSSSNTLESFVENRSVLQNALQRNFSENTSSSISLDFGMQNDSTNQSFQESRQEQSQNTNNQNILQDVVEEETEVNSDYM
jgi:hypothetical protein